MDPKVASELSLRIPHLALRMREHSARAQLYAGAPALCCHLSAICWAVGQIPRACLALVPAL